MAPAYASSLPANLGTVPAVRGSLIAPPWLSDRAVQAIVRRAAHRVVARLCDPALEVADVEQDLYVVLDGAMRHHDARLASVATFAAAVVSRTVLQMIRDAHADRRRANLQADAEVELTASGGEHPERTAILRRDLAGVVEALSPSDRELLRLKITGTPVGQIATLIGVHRDTVHARMVSVRSRFVALGADREVA